MGRVRRSSSGVRLRCSRRKDGTCSRYSLWSSGGPAARRPTLSPAPLSRLGAPPRLWPPAVRAALADPPGRPAPGGAGADDDHVVGDLRFLEHGALVFLARVPGCYNGSNAEAAVNKKSAVLPVVSEGSVGDIGRRHVLQGLLAATGAAVS